MDWSDYEVDGQLSIFDLTMEEFKITKPIRLIELFSGVGSQAMALRELGADFEHYRVVEFDKYAIASYNAIHNTDFTAMDITKVSGADLGIADVDRFTYLLTYSFPCQDLSVAGKQAGMTKGSNTRSGLLWEVERLLNEVENLPQVLLMENVPQVHGQKNMQDFQKWIDFLKSKGYSNYWQDLNAKNYGVAQNRDRCFMVSILGEWNYKFPQPITLTKTMKDYLEDEVDEKYYINNEKAQKLIDTLIANGTIPRAEQSRAEQSRAEQSRLALTLQSMSLEKSVSQIASAQGQTEESLTEVQREVVLLKECVDLTVNKPRNISVANCLVAHLAKDGIAISRRKSEGNGVIEWK